MSKKMFLHVWKCFTFSVDKFIMANFMTGAIFASRNWDMACNDNGARVAVAAGQAVKTTQGLSEIGFRPAENAVSYMETAAKEGSLLAKSAKFLANAVNPLIVGASAIKVAVADDKEKALCTVAPGIGAMFAGEAAFKSFVKTAPAQEVLSKIASVGGKGGKWGKILAVGTEGVAFATASILSYAGGAAVGEYAINKERELKAQNKMNYTA